jgi:hypothetical protein
VSDDDNPLRAGPRLSTFAGLHEAGILNWIEFDPVDGLVRVRYAPTYRRILEAGMAKSVDANFVVAVLLDDPRAMLRWIEAAGARLEGEAGCGPAAPPDD